MSLMKYYISLRITVRISYYRYRRNDKLKIKKCRTCNSLILHTLQKYENNIFDFNFTMKRSGFAL